MVTSREIKELLAQVPGWRRSYLQESITTHKATSSLMGRRYNRPLCEYVEAVLGGRKPKSLERRRRLHGPVTTTRRGVPRGG